LQQERASLEAAVAARQSELEGQGRQVEVERAQLARRHQAFEQQMSERLDALHAQQGALASRTKAWESACCQKEAEWTAQAQRLKTEEAEQREQLAAWHREFEAERSTWDQRRAAQESEEAASRAKLAEMQRLVETQREELARQQEAFSQMAERLLSLRDEPGAAVQPGEARLPQSPREESTRDDPPQRETEYTGWQPDPTATRPTRAAPREPSSPESSGEPKPSECVAPARNLALACQSAKLDKDRRLMALRKKLQEQPDQDSGRGILDWFTQIFK
jgi:hypothetical protein